MALTPLVSVVMSVYNGADKLVETIDSILEQKGVEFEFIIVNDGSTDDSCRILHEYSAKDSRVKIISQENRGLTRSLIIGCDAAGGDLIARQDAGDVSLPGRLRIQAGTLRNNPDVVMVSCGTRFLGPEGEMLHDVLQSDEVADDGLRQPGLASLKGPSHHGCTMFRRDVYERAGGYRPEFIVAQDLDMWTRLVEFGSHAIVPEVLYEAVLTPGSISSTRRGLQQKATEVIIECMKARRATGDDREQLNKLAEIHVHDRPVSQHKSDADFYYFISSLLKNSNADAAQHYLRMALRSNPWHYKAWVRSLQGLMGF